MWRKGLVLGRVHKFRWFSTWVRSDLVPSDNNGVLERYDNAKRVRQCSTRANNPKNIQLALDSKTDTIHVDISLVISKSRYVYRQLKRFQMLDRFRKRTGLRSGRQCQFQSVLYQLKPTCCPISKKPINKKLANAVAGTTSQPYAARIWNGRNNR